METFCACIKDYNKELGPFINYFSRALKKNYSKAKAKEEIENARCGISIPEKKQRLAFKIIKYVKSSGLNLKDIKNKEILAKQLNVDINDIEDGMLILGISSTSNNQYNENGDEFDLFDTIVDKNEYNSDDNDMLDTYFNVATKVFDLLQERQKKLIALFFSRECFMEYESEYGPVIANGKLKDYNFYSGVIYKFFIVKKRVPTQRELAEYCGVSEQSASRSYSNFKQKISENVKKTQN